MVRLRLQIYHQTADSPPKLQGYGGSNSLKAAESRRQKTPPRQREELDRLLAMWQILIS